MVNFSAGEGEEAEVLLVVGDDVDVGVAVGEAGEVIVTIRRG